MWSASVSTQWFINIEQDGSDFKQLLIILLSRLIKACGRISFPCSRYMSLKCNWRSLRSRLVNVLPNMKRQLLALGTGWGMIQRWKKRQEISHIPKTLQLSPRGRATLPFLTEMVVESNLDKCREATTKSEWGKVAWRWAVDGGEGRCAGAV